jgi:malonate-semialdehyde dehydrogenase (acetylating) / methylmalonate-semialdehyde dehydrogenase
MVVRENGKTMSEARGEVRRGIDMIEYACGIPSLLMGRTLPDVSHNVDTYSIREPLGGVVVGAAGQREAFLPVT